MIDSVDATPRATRGLRLAFGAAVFVASLVAADAFVWTYHGNDDYGHRVAGLSYLSPVVPIGLDGLTLVAVAATFLLRHAPLRVRLYAWMVFGVAMSLSIAGNLSHADSRHLGWQGMAGAAVAPVLLGLSSHLVIVVRRALDRPVAAEPAPVVAPTVVAAQPAPPTVAELALPPRRPSGASRPSRGVNLADVRSAFYQRERAGDVAQRLGTSKRTVERAYAALRAQEPADDVMETL